MATKATATTTSNSTPVYTWQATGTGGYWALVGGATVGAVWGTRGAWQAHVRHTNTYGTGTSRSAALANAMGPQGTPAPAHTAPQAPQHAAPAPQVPTGRSKARTALLCLLWVLVAVLATAALVARAYAKGPALVARLATTASTTLRTYARSL